MSGRLRAAVVAVLVAAATLAPASALACSPAFNPTIAELGWAGGSA